MIEEYTIRVADNGWIVSWWVDDDEPMRRNVVFQVPEDHDNTKADPMALVDFLYFIKETVCDVQYSKHKSANCMVRMEGSITDKE